MANRTEKPLQHTIALVAGATRGAGRGIARMLGEAGATVYCTGRSSRAGRAESAEMLPDTPPEMAHFVTETRPETIEETAEMVTALGGQGIAVRVDHTVEEEVAALCAQIQREQGRLHVLVNDVWGGDALTEWETPFWESSMDKALLMQRRAVFSHLITSRYAVPVMLQSAAPSAERVGEPPFCQGLVVEITDGEGERYRGNLSYDLAKSSAIRLAHGMAEELRPQNIAALSLTPGFLRSEAVLEHFGVTETNWREGVEKDPNFIASETPAFIGRAVAALAADPRLMEKSGGVYSSWALAREYAFTDEDGSQPDWGAHFSRLMEGKE